MINFDPGGRITGMGRHAVQGEAAAPFSHKK